MVPSPPNLAGKAKRSLFTVKSAVYRNTPGEQYLTVSMVTHTVTTETVKYCSPGVFSYTAFFTLLASFGGGGGGGGGRSPVKEGIKSDLMMSSRACR